MTPTIKLLDKSQINQLPAPSPDNQLYEEIKQQGFKKFPQRLENYNRFLKSTRGISLDYDPIRIDIENVSRCNYRCKMCSVSDWKGGKRADDMSLSHFKELLDSLPSLIEIKLQGLGEPLMGKSIFEMIRYARSEKHLWVRSTTNGSLLAHQENYKKIIDSDICDLSVSIDGASQKSYETIRRGGKFNIVSENCKLLNDYADKKDFDRIRMCTVVQQDNVHELETFPTLAAELGFKRLTFSLDINDWGIDQWKEKNASLSCQNQLDVDRLWHLIDLGKSLGVEIGFWHIDQKYHWKSEKNLCPWPFERLYISSDMRITPCCMVANPDVYQIGENAFDIKSTWHGEPYRKFRQQHLEGNLPAICRSCYLSKEHHPTT